MIDHREYQAACDRADKILKQDNGHSFVISLKTRCQYCRRSPRAKGRCRYWFQHFLNLLYAELQEVPFHLEKT